MEKSFSAKNDGGHYLKLFLFKTHFQVDLRELQVDFGDFKSPDTDCVIMSIM